MRILPSTPPLRAAVALCVLAGAVLGAGCRREDPREVATTFERARIAGDRLRARTLLSRADSVALASPAGRTLRLESVGLPAAGEPGTTLDSARVDSTYGDTVRVRTFYTVPNWDAVGGRYRWRSPELVDLAVAEPQRIATLPRITDRGAIRLVRDGRRWRVALGVAEELRARPLWQAMLSNDSLYPARVAAARAFLRVATGLTPGSLPDSTARDVITAGALADSIDLAVRLQPIPSYLAFTGNPSQIAAEVVNRSGHILRHVEILVHFTSGEQQRLGVYDIAPGDRKDATSMGRWSGEIVRYYPIGIEAR